MFEFETGMSRPSAHELHRQARREQARMVNAFIGSAARKFAGWLATPVRSGAKIVRTLAAEWRLLKMRTGALAGPRSGTFREPAD